MLTVEENKKITIEDINSIHDASTAISYLVEILNGEYDVKTARDDILGLIGSKYDSRIES